MSRMQQIIVGWGIAIGAIGLASLAFPSISQKAADQRENAYWQERATEFQARAADFEQASPFLGQLTALYTDERFTHAGMRDHELLKDLSQMSRKDILNAKHKARELHCLSEAIYYEARSERLSGQMAVAEVVQNRVKSKHYPNSICGVVYQGAERRTGCQFTFTCDGSTALQPRGKHWDRSQKVAQMMITGIARPMTQRATHYHTVNIDPHWSSSLQMTKTIGSHKFYRFKWRERPVASSIAVAPPSP